MRERKRCFSLTELIIVIAILAILISLLSPSLRNMRDRAMSMKCFKNMKQISQVFMIYQNDFDDALPPHGPSKNGDFVSQQNGGPYNDYASFNTSITGYEEGFPISKWGKDGKMTLAHYVCPSDAESRYLGANDRRKTSYNDPYEVWKYVGPRKKMYGNNGGEYVLPLQHVRHPSETAAFGEAPYNNLADPPDGRAGWTRDPSSNYALNIVGESRVWGTKSIPTMGLRLSHRQMSSHNLLFFDYHVEEIKFPDVPDGLIASWLSD